MVAGAQRSSVGGTRTKITWRRFLLRYLVFSATTSLLILIGLGCALSCRPSWYLPASIDYGLLDEDKHDLTQLLDDISRSLNTRRDIEVELSEDQINRWLSARAELDLLSLLPGIDTSGLNRFDQPFVSLLEPNRVRIALRVELRGFPLIASFTIAIEPSDQTLHIVWEAVQTGVLSLPGAILQRIVPNLLSGVLDPSALESDGSISIPNDLVWPNGQRRFRIRVLEIRDGTARLLLTPV